MGWKIVVFQVAQHYIAHGNTKIMINQSYIHDMYVCMCSNYVCVLVIPRSAVEYSRSPVPEQGDHKSWTGGSPEGNRLWNQSVRSDRFRETSYELATPSF